MRKPTKFFLISSCYFFLSLLFTYPLILHFQEGVFGMGHPINILWRWWYYKQAFVHNFSQQFTTFIGSPSGSYILSTFDPPLIFYLGKFFTLISNEVIAYNIIFLFAVFSSGFFMYLLLKEYWNNEQAAFIGGIFWLGVPYRVNHFYQISLFSVQFIPLFLFCLLRFEKQKSFQNLLLLALSFTLVLITDYYHFFFLCLFLVFFFIFRLFLKDICLKELFRLLKFFFPLCLFTFLFSLPFIYPLLSFKLFGSSIPQKALQKIPINAPEEAMLNYSTRPWEFLLPRLDRYPHVIGEFGEKIFHNIYFLTNDFKTRIHWTAESGYFLGFTTFGLSCLAMLLSKKLEKRRFWIFIFTAGALMIIGLPPFIFIKGKKILLVSHFLHKILPSFRVYGRLSLFINLCFIFTAALGIKKLIELSSSPKIKIIIFYLLVFLTAFEFCRPFLTQNFVFTKHNPQAYQFIESLPSSTLIAEYFPAYFKEKGSYLGKHPISRLYQRLHKKLTFGPGQIIWYDLLFPRESAGSFVFEKGPFDKNIISYMHSKGVNYYLVFTKSPVKTFVNNKKKPIFILPKAPESLKLVKSFDGASVYSFKN